MLADLDSRDLGFRHDGAWPSAGIAAGTAAATRPGFESELSVWQSFSPAATSISMRCRGARVQPLRVDI